MSRFSLLTCSSASLGTWMALASSCTSSVGCTQTSTLPGFWMWVSCLGCPRVFPFKGMPLFVYSVSPLDELQRMLCAVPVNRALWLCRTITCPAFRCAPPKGHVTLTQHRIGFDGPYHPLWCIVNWKGVIVPGINGTHSREKYEEIAGNKMPL